MFQVRIKWAPAMLWAAVLSSLPLAVQADPVATFEDLSTPIPYSGGGAYWNGSDGSGGFADGNLSFTNAFDQRFGTWSGWAYSNTTDTTTPGFANQYSALPGGGAEGSLQYGVYFEPFTLTPTISLPTGGTNVVSGAYFTNTTYAGLSVRDGDAFAKKFGGTSGNDPDWFLLSIIGKDLSGATTGTVDFYLADYRFSDNSRDYIVDSWQWVDLTSLGAVAALQFDLSSSDVGSFGMNTPAYFAADNITTVPEPETLALSLLAAAGLAYRKTRRRRSKSSVEAPT